MAIIALFLSAGKGTEAASGNQEHGLTRSGKLERVALGG